MATDNAAPVLLTLDRSDGSATLDLYRAALGPWHADYYLKTFTRFDAAGKAGTSWNWTAALLTLNWMLFRQLWLPALAYVGALTAAALLLLGIGRLLFGLSEASQWALGGLAVLLAFALPGARGNAWLYAACNRKMEAALAASADQQAACALLAARASSRKHQWRLAAGNLAFFGVLATMVMAWPDSAALAQKAHPVQEARLAPAAANAVVAPLAPAAASVPGRTSQGQVQPAPATAPPLPTAPPRAAAGASAPAAVAVPVTAPLPAVVASVAVPAAASASAGPFMVNVGLFADPNNARNAYTKLRDAGLPALSQELKSAKGKPRTRIRVGPFESQAEAERAAERIRALKLEAAVFQQKT